MKCKLIYAGLATAMALGVGAASATAAPVGAATGQHQLSNELMVKVHGDRYDNRPWWKRHRFHRYNHGYRDRPWWWRNRYFSDNRRFDKHDHRHDDRGDRRRNRDW